MSRPFARALGLLAIRLVPAPLEDWGWAILHEIDEIEGDAAAIAFALDALRGAFAQTLAFYLSGGSTTMSLLDTLRRPRPIGLACAIGASSLGLVYMAIAGAPARYLAINAAALLIGLLVFAMIGKARQLPGGVMLALSGLLLATALFGHAPEGAARWLMFGPLFVQPSLLLLPLMIVGYARTRTALATGGMIVAAGALALQPDRAMAGVLVAGLAALACFRPDRRVALALAVAIAGFIITMVRPDTLPAVAYVDQILYLAFDTGLLAGLAVLGGSVLLVVPALASLRDGADRDAYAAFGAVWLTAVVAAAIGNYPTPLVGYGGSAVIGYILSIALLPRVARDQVETGAARPAPMASSIADAKLPRGLYSAS